MTNSTSPLKNAAETLWQLALTPLNEAATNVATSVLASSASKATQISQEPVGTVPVVIDAPKKDDTTPEVAQDSFSKAEVIEPLTLHLTHPASPFASPLASSLLTPLETHSVERKDVSAKSPSVAPDTSQDEAIAQLLSKEDAKTTHLTHPASPLASPLASSLVTPLVTHSVERKDVPARSPAVAQDTSNDEKIAQLLSKEDAKTTKSKGKGHKHGHHKHGLKWEHHHIHGSHPGKYHPHGHHHKKK